jgi:hypothetical protein
LHLKTERLKIAE